MQFKDLQLNKSILKAITEKGYTEVTPIQEKTIPLILAKKDIIASAQTGTGKTAAFALPIIQMLFDRQDSGKKGKKIKALVVSPTRELAIQIQENFKIYAQYSNLTSTIVYGGASIEPQKDILKKGVDILIATPGRLLDLNKQDCVNLSKVETLVLDEADLMLDMGFIDDVKKINRLCPKNKQTLLFSATMPRIIVELANSMLNEPLKVAISPKKTTADTVTQLLYYVPVPKKIELCLHLLRNTVKGDILIFRRTKFGVDKLEQSLLKNGYSVACIHGDKTQKDRENSLNKFKNKEVNILIATDVASRGIDIHDLDAVINFDIPNIPETYIHRIGRTGRAGKTGKAYSFCGADEKNYITTIQKLINGQIPIEESHPYPLDKNAKELYFKKDLKNKKGRKSAGSKKNKKRWY